MVMDSAHDQFPVGLRVLVVDDDPTCLFILERMLQRCSYNVTTCGQATIALAMLRQNKHRFDLVISDVYMPDMDGFKLLELVGLEMNIPVIMMSVDGEFSVVMKGVTHGACDYLLKPVRMEELRNIWQHVVRKKQCQARDVAHGDIMEDIEKLKYGSEHSEYTNSKKRKDSKDNDPDSEDPSTLKKQRVVWSPQLHKQFVDAVNQLGIDKAVPKRILDIMNVPGLTRENVASHLQKYRLYLKRLSFEQHHGQSLSYPESLASTIGPPFWVGPGEFLMPAGNSQLLPEALTSARSGFARSLSLPNNSGLGTIDSSSRFIQFSAVEGEPSSLFKKPLQSSPIQSNVGPDTTGYQVNHCPPIEEIIALGQVGLPMDGVVEPHASHNQLVSIKGFEPPMGTIRTNQTLNSSLSDLITDFSQQQKYSHQSTGRMFDESKKYSMTSAELLLRQLSPRDEAVASNCFNQHVNLSGLVCDGQLTGTSSKGVSTSFVPTGNENLEYSSHNLTKRTGISNFENSKFTDFRSSIDLLGATSSAIGSASLLKNLHSGPNNRTSVQHSESGMTLQKDVSAETEQYASLKMKSDRQTQALSLWQETVKSPAPHVCSVQTPSESHAAFHMEHNPEKIQDLHSLGLDQKLRENNIIHQGKGQGYWDLFAAHTNMKLKEGHQGFDSGIKAKLETGNLVLQPFLSNDLLGFLMKENTYLQQQKPAFQEHEVGMDGFTKGSLYVN
ncbi:hypothetical protein O6H91_17G016400 [Diphasiastrum complanatum]|uniref:Uncharacterized protein n=1 Tax=Diphasiastrum complanatum TaxID=34168 RepID=A0ACC2B4K6_DIPCM|nr:hypothetical protein O6H91_17G016400 [Diphasiastrum complanatum]